MPQGLKRCECAASVLSELANALQAFVDSLREASGTISDTAMRTADAADGETEDGARKSNSKPSSLSILPVLDNVINNIASLDLEQSDKKAQADETSGEDDTEK